MRIKINNNGQIMVDNVLVSTSRGWQPEKLVSIELKLLGHRTSKYKYPLDKLSKIREIEIIIIEGR